MNILSNALFEFFDLFGQCFTFLDAATTKRESLISSSILNASDVTPASAGFGYFDFRLKFIISKKRLFKNYKMIAWKSQYKDFHLISWIWRNFHNGHTIYRIWKCFGGRSNLLFFLTWKTGVYEERDLFIKLINQSDYFQIQIKALKTHQIFSIMFINVPKANFAHCCSNISNRFFYLAIFRLV